MSDISIKEKGLTIKQLGNDVEPSFELFYPDTYKRISIFFEQKLRRDEKYDLYILLKPDVEFIQDGTRDADNDRDKHYEMIKNEMTKRSFNFVEIGGNWEERFEKSISHITKYNI